MNMFARFDENPAMTLQDIKETKRYGWTHRLTIGRTTYKQYTHHKQSLRGYYNFSFYSQVGRWERAGYPLSGWEVGEGKTYHILFYSQVGRWERGEFFVMLGGGEGNDYQFVILQSGWEVGEVGGILQQVGRWGMGRPIKFFILQSDLEVREGEESFVRLGVGKRKDLIIFFILQSGMEVREDEGVRLEGVGGRRNPSSSWEVWKVEWIFCQVGRWGGTNPFLSPPSNLTVQ